jgi:hypothetical protein
VHLAWTFGLWQAGGMRKHLKSPRPASTPEERRQWVSRYRASGLTQAQFAQQQGLKVCTLQRWLYGRGSWSWPRPKRKEPTLRAEEGTKYPGGRGASVLARHRRRAGSVTFHEVKVSHLCPGGIWVAEIAWPSGVTVRLGAGAEAAWIASLLGMVRQVC